MGGAAGGGAAGGGTSASASGGGIGFDPFSPTAQAISFAASTAGAIRELAVLSQSGPSPTVTTVKTSGASVSGATPGLGKTNGSAVAPVTVHVRLKE